MNNIKNRLSVKDAANLLNISPQFVKIGLRQGILPWGYAIQMSTHWTYYISPNKFSKDTGIIIKGTDYEIEQYVRKVIKRRLLSLQTKEPR